MSSHLRLRDLDAPREDVAVVVSAFRDVLLVILLGRPKGSRGSYLRLDGERVAPRLLDCCFGRVCKGRLLRTVVEDHRSVLRATFIRSLVIARRRIVHLPEHVEEHLVRDVCRVVGHFANLNVSGRPPMNLLVGRCIDRSTHVADPACDNARNRAQHMLGSPEASGTERRALHSSHTTARGPVGDAQDHGQVVGDEDHGHSPLHLQVLEQLEQLGLLAGVEHGDGLVGYQQLGCQNQCPSQRHPLQLPAGQLMRVAAEEGVVTGEPARLDGGADQLYVAWLPSFGDWSTNKRFCRSGARLVTGAT